MHMRHRLAAALAAIAIALAGVAAFSTNASAQTATPVQQGQTVNLGSIDPFLDNFTVDPVAAGTVYKDLVIVPGTGPDNSSVSASLRFTASSSFIGPATIRQSDGTAAFSVLVVGPSASLGATFTPRPAPGPCIQILSGGTISFGDVTVGDVTPAAIPTVVRNCSSNRNAVLSGSVSEATNGTGANATVLEPVITAAGPNEINYRLVPTGSTAGTNGRLDDDSLVALIDLPSGFILDLDHELTVGVGSTTGLNSTFNATVTLLATAA